MNHAERENLRQAQIAATIKMPRDKAGAATPRLTFIDLFSGCGGLSLGLCQAGWRGQFAIERATDAFETFRANFLSENSRYTFDWPAWLAKSAHSIEHVLESKADEIAELRGAVHLIAGGPPCQGFSFAGRRNASDPRNKMFRKYVEFVDLVRPKLLVLENVPGMNVAHADGRGTSRSTYYQKLIEELDAIGYEASGCVLDATEFGVPQRRDRLVVIGVDTLALGPSESLVGHLFDNVRKAGLDQLQELGGRKVSARCAISDLEGEGRSPDSTIDYVGVDSRRGFRQVRYKGPKSMYQEYMHEAIPSTTMDSMRLANHSVAVQARFKKILKASENRRGLNLTRELREHLGMLKHRTVPMNPHKPAPTLTTLPDDVLHYSEPRILTVREYARIQSFPDWFVFRGKYTTGGLRRKSECPRYTQVGNAVPPLLGKAIGRGLSDLLNDESRYGSSDLSLAAREHRG